MNARLGGDPIPCLGKLATGIDPGELAAVLATGGTMPAVRPERRGIVGIRFAYPLQDCRVTALTLPDPATMPGLLEAVATATPGTELRPPPKGCISRYAYVICTGADRAECAGRIGGQTRRWSRPRGRDHRRYRCLPVISWWPPSCLPRS